MIIKIIPTILILIGLLGLLTISIVLTKYKSNKMVNPYLIITISLISARFIIFGLGALHIFKNSNELISNYNQFFIILVPSMYLYIKNLVSHRKFILVQDVKHSILPIIFSVFIIKMEGQTTSIVVPGKIAILLCLVTYFFYYWYNLFKLLLQPKLENNKFSIIQKKEDHSLWRWSLFLFILASLSLINGAVSGYVVLFVKNSITHYNSYLLFSALIWMVVFLKILFSPKILFGSDSLKIIVKEEKITNFELEKIWAIPAKKEITNLQDLELKKLIDLRIIEYIEQIERIAIEFDLFKNCKFSSSDLALKVKIPKSHLTYIFKYHSNLSFSDFKKVIRIHDAIKQIELNYLKNNTLDSLSKKVGFTSYNPFFTSFKEIVGLSPLEYYKMNRAEFEE